MLELKDWLENKYWDNWSNVKKKAINLQDTLKSFAEALEEHIFYTILLEEKVEEETLRRLLEDVIKLRETINSILDYYKEKYKVWEEERIQRRLSQ